MKEVPTSTVDGLEDSPCNVGGELGKGLKATASLSMTCGGLRLLTAEVSIVIVGLLDELKVSKTAMGL